MSDTLKKPEAKTDDSVSLKSICASMKVDPKEARTKLRGADAKEFPQIAKHKAGHVWSWPKNSPALKGVRALLAK
jgi:hypothetical protein